MTEIRLSEEDASKRDIPSFIEPRPPLIQHPFMRPRPQKRTNLMELFEEDSEAEEPELVQVYLRIRPCNVPSNLYEIRSDKCLLTSLDTTTAGHGRRTQQNVSRMYTFSKIFTAQASQKELFETVVKENLKKLPEGHSYTLLTYGASGSGKTYTLMGTVNAPGLVPRSLEYVFKLVDAAQKPLYKPSDTGADMLSEGQQEFELQWVKRLRQVSAALRDKYRRMSAQLHTDLTDSNFDLSNRTKHYVWVSFLEIYNEAIYDLLAPPQKRTKLRIREDSSGNVYVKDATQAFVRSGEEAYDVMAAGKQNLVVAATGVHAQSSRSHCIFTITMLTQSDGEIRTSHVRLCDLAGCERARATRNTGTRMQESRAINTSLHVLERCLHTLRRKQRQHLALVPYRESKLTRLLGSGLSGSRGEAVSMVVTLNPAPQFAQETKHVLSLAAVATDIQINNTIFAASTLSLESSTSQDTTLETNAEIMKLRAENEMLRFELMQSEARNRELKATLEAAQKQSANTMLELVEEAKAMTRDFYEAQIQMLKADMEDMKEEYESRLAEVASPPRRQNITVTSPTYLPPKVTQIMTRVAVLEEQLAEEKLARAIAEKEAEHLRLCIDERDVEENSIEKSIQKSQEEPDNDEICITDSDDEDDPFNESLEPTFKKDKNKLKTLDTFSYDSKEDKSSEADQFEDCDTASKNSILDEDKSDIAERTISLSVSTKTEFNSCEISKEKTVDESNLNENAGNEINIKENTVNESKKRMARGTYFVKDTDSYESLNCELKDKTMETDKDNLVEEISLEANKRFQDSPKHELVSMKPKVLETTVDKKIKLAKSKDSNDSSLTQFEKLERAANDFIEHEDLDKIPFRTIEKDNEITKPIKNDTENSIPSTTEGILASNLIKQKRTYFDNIVPHKVLDNNMVADIKQSRNEERSPSIVKDDVDNYYKPQSIKKNIGDGTSVQKLYKKHESVDLFEPDSPYFKAIEILKDKAIENIDVADIKLTDINNVELVRKSIEKLELKQETDEKPNGKESPIVETANLAVEIIKAAVITTDVTDDIKEKEQNYNELVIIPSTTKIENITEAKPFEAPKVTITEQTFNETQNTTAEFENIYKDVSKHRETEFELLVKQETNNTTTTDDLKTETVTNKNEDIKYNLRKKSKAILNTTDDKNKKEEFTEILAESSAKCEIKPKRNLRLRRRKNQDDGTHSDPDQESKSDKLKDLLNLKNEFSDVTMGLPAVKKVVHDIPSPEKRDEENVPPAMGTMSCPAASVTRSRRKLFTPRAEPLEESLSQTGTGDSNERLYVPRPSYHRGKARRKL